MIQCNTTRVLFNKKKKKNKFLHQLNIVCSSDPRTKDCFLAQSPLIPIVIVALYFQFVQKWGPNMMKNRPAFNLNKVLVFYNVFQIVLSTRLFYLVSLTKKKNIFKFKN